MSDWQQFLKDIADVARLEREHPEDAESIRLAWQELNNKENNE